MLCLPAVLPGRFVLCARGPRCWSGTRARSTAFATALDLIRGNWWRTVMVYLVVLTMIIVSVYVTAGLIVAVCSRNWSARGTLAVTTAVSAVMVVASGAVYMPFVTSMALAVYGDLQARKEGTDLERRIAGAPAG